MQKSLKQNYTRLTKVQNYGRSSRHQYPVTSRNASLWYSSIRQHIPW